MRASKGMLGNSMLLRCSLIWHRQCWGDGGAVQPVLYMPSCMCLTW